MKIWASSKWIKCCVQWFSILLCMASLGCGKSAMRETSGVGTGLSSAISPAALHFSIEDPAPEASIKMNSGEFEIDDSTPAFADSLTDYWNILQPIPLTPVPGASRFKTPVLRWSDAFEQHKVLSAEVSRGLWTLDGQSIAESGSEPATHDLATQSFTAPMSGWPTLRDRTVDPAQLLRIRIEMRLSSGNLRAIEIRFRFLASVPEIEISDVGFSSPGVFGFDRELTLRRLRIHNPWGRPIQVQVAGFGIGQSLFYYHRMNAHPIHGALNQTLPGNSSSVFWSRAGFQLTRYRVSSSAEDAAPARSQPLSGSDSWKLEALSDLFVDFVGVPDSGSHYCEFNPNFNREITTQRVAIPDNPQFGYVSAQEFWPEVTEVRNSEHEGNFQNEILISDGLTPGFRSVFKVTHYLRSATLPSLQIGKMSYVNYNGAVSPMLGCENAFR